MQNRVPIARDARPPLPDFDPVPRKYRHDGWTPERQRAFIEVLADTGCVSRAAAQVNMSPEGAYYLRRQKGAETFRRAWEAALDFGVQRLKDIAFERAIDGQLVPVFVGGKLLGFRRKRNDRLLMFCLRHYGQDTNGRRVTVNYFSSRATAGAVTTQNPPRDGEGYHAQHGGGGSEPRTLAPKAALPAIASAEASTTTIRTTISNPDHTPASIANRDDTLAATLNAFEGVELDEAAQAEIQRVLEACAERRRALTPDHATPLSQAVAMQAADPECDFIRVPNDSAEYAGELESGYESEEFTPFREGEQPWESIGAPVPEWFVEWEKEQAAKFRQLPPPDEAAAEDSLP
ncbi:MAG: hypothetical protein M3Q15_04925, partial [Pseudomonadota bacterium]|nr:hypothetical protein [Pseudomonadota bacterium]